MCSLRVLICSVAACCLRRTDHDAVADRDDRLLLWIAGISALAALHRARAGADVLALMAETGGALADLETARLAEIVLPGISAVALVGPALAQGLRADEGRSLFQRKADLRIGGEVGVAAPFARAAVGDDVAARVIGEVGRGCGRPLGDVGRDIPARPRRLAAGDAQRFQETLGDRIGLAASQPPRPRRRVEALDRHHIGHAEAREGVTHVTFADEAPHIGKLRRQRLDRFTLAAEGIGEIVGEDRAGDLHLDRPGEGPLRHAIACTGLEREHRVVTGCARVEQVDGAEIGLIARHRQAVGRAALSRVEIVRGIERQQHRNRAAPDAGEDRRGDRVQLHQRRRRTRIPARRPPLAAKVKAEAIAGWVLISERS